MSPLFRSLILFGIATGVLMGAYATVEFFLGLHGKYLSVGQYVGYLRYVILFLGLFLGVKNVRDKQFGGVIGYGKVVQVGFIISLIAGVIITVYEMLYIEYINPGFLNDYTQFMVAGMRGSGATEADVQAFTEQVKSWSSPVVQVMFYMGETSVLGLVFSLVLGGILKKRPQTQS